MRNEWAAQLNNNGVASAAATSRSFQGLTRSRQTESGKLDARSGLDRSASLTMAQKAMKLKGTAQQGGMVGEGRKREVSERRMVGDAESLVNASSVDDPQTGTASKHAWWRHVTMEEGM